MGSYIVLGKNDFSPEIPSAPNFSYGHRSELLPLPFSPSLPSQSRVVCSLLSLPPVTTPQSLKLGCDPHF